VVANTFQWVSLLAGIGTVSIILISFYKFFSSLESDLNQISDSMENIEKMIEDEKKRIKYEKTEGHNSVKKYLEKIEAEATISLMGSEKNRSEVKIDFKPGIYTVGIDEEIKFDEELEEWEIEKLGDEVICTRVSEERIVLEMPTDDISKISKYVDQVLKKIQEYAETHSVSEEKFDNELAEEIDGEIV
jgi:hypothetical protein